MNCMHVISGAEYAFADCLKCIAWKGRALVVGFAAGQIEKVLHLQNTHNVGGGIT